MLHAAALSAFVVDRANQLIEKGKGRCLVRCEWFVWYLLIVILLTMYVVYFAMMSLQEFVEARSRELQTGNKVKTGMTVKGKWSQARSATEGKYHPWEARE